MLLNSLLLRNGLVLTDWLGELHVSSESEESSDSDSERQYRKLWKTVSYYKEGISTGCSSSEIGCTETPKVTRGIETVSVVSVVLRTGKNGFVPLVIRYPQRGCSSKLMPSAVLATTSCVRKELAGWIRPRRASRTNRS